MENILRDEKGRFKKGIHPKTEFKKGLIPWIKGRHHTKETKEKLRKTSSGRHHTEEAKRKISEAGKGNEYNLGRKLSEETKNKMSLARIGIIFSEGHRKKISENMMGNKHSLGNNHSEGTKRKISESHKKRYLLEENRKKIIGENGHNWRGGKTPLGQIIRSNNKYKKWLLMVFDRDNFTCQKCGRKGSYLNAHHIKSFSSILQYYEITSLEEALECKELWDIKNGITLCEECHKKTDSYLFNYKEKKRGQYGIKSRRIRRVNK